MEKVRKSHFLRPTPDRVVVEEDNTTASGGKDGKKSHWTLRAVI